MNSGNLEIGQQQQHIVPMDQNSMRNICNFLQPPSNIPASLQPGACPYDHIIDMIKGLDLQDDGIVMNHKIKSIETDFCNIVLNEHMLCESMEYINDKALTDGDTALKFALLFSSRNFDVLAMNDTKVRSAMLKLLETNFINADQYRMQDRDRLYNSITLLGEYYHRVRLADNSPITILGESLLGLLLREVSELEPIDVKLGRLILSQITLNGDIMREKHKTELTQLLYHIRRNLIEQPVLKPAVKAYLLMTLDLYYSNFANLGPQLEKMYTEYLVQEDEDEGNNNNLEAEHHQQQPFVLHHQPQLVNSQMPAPVVYNMPNQPMQPPMLIAPPAMPVPITMPVPVQTPIFENGNSGIESSVNDSFELQPSNKKWSEQVCEDSFESELYNGQANTSSELGYDNEHDSNTHKNRRSYQPRNSPRPLKNNYNGSERNISSHNSQQSVEEERDESKPLPRWRAARFNRDSLDQPTNNGRPRNNHRRYSASFDEDGHSVRSEGGSIRLYSINDRLKHSQEKISGGGGNNYNAVANWDHQSRDDRSERSYISNYERGNHNHRRGHNSHYNNRYHYDKPPRFQKNNQQQQQQQNYQKDSWRRSNQQQNHHNNSSGFVDENSSYRSNNGPDSNSRSSSRARTLPRPAKSNMDGGGADILAAVSSYRRSQSPSQQYGTHNSRPRNFNNRYSSQSSLASEASSTMDRRHPQQHHQRNRNFARNHRNQNQQDQTENWNDTNSLHGKAEQEGDNSELVRNARKTSKYMNYLSSQK